MLWRLLRSAAILGIPPALAAAAPGIIQVTSVRSWSHADSTRVIIQTTGPFEYRSDHADNPDRLFFDVLRARPWLAKRRYATQEIGDKLVRRVRIAETSPGTTRIVFDLVSPVDYKITRLEAPDRMVIELRPLHSSRPPVPSEPSLVSVARPFAYPPFVYPPIPRAQHIAIPGPPPMLAPAPERLPFYFADPITALIAAIPSKPVKMPRVINARVTPIIPPAVADVRAPVGAPPLATPTHETPIHESAGLASENASRSLTRALGLKVNRIVIDAGHGGHDDGTIGPHGVMEKDVVLDVALRLAKLVKERLGAEVVLTRSDDTFIALHDRTAMANEHKADLFLSIHANSSPAPEVAGTETFYLNFTNSSDVLNVAARENAGSDKSVGELRDLIQTITMNDKIEESHTFAQDVQSAIQAQALKSNVAARNRGVKRAPFVVLIGASMPSVLAEIGFLSNSRDESNLGKPEYRQKVAEALYRGLAQYSQSLSHFESPRQIVKAADAKSTEKPITAGLN
jgi:N-acetylmuramoyl-L-alanine amidase